jgi:hypothetical protein
MMEQIKACFEDYNPTPNEKEAQTEEDWVRPVLKALGHTDFAVHPSLKVPGSPQAPDYVFYNDQASKDANATHKLLDDKLLESKAYAVGDAKRCARSTSSPAASRTSRSISVSGYSASVMMTFIPATFSTPD